MTRELESYLIFDGYTVSKMEFKRNYSFDDNKEIELEFSFDGSVKISDDNRRALMELNCDILNDDFLEGKAPFYLQIGLLGKFELSVDDDKFNIEDFQLNGLAILLPYLRSIVTSFTSQAGIPPVILPPINVYNAFKMINSTKE